MVFLQCIVLLVRSMSPVIRPLVLAGPSGVGKSTLIRRLFADFPARFGLSVSHTTRNSREGEEDGVHYHFVAKPEMETAMEKGGFLEIAHVHGNIYGTSATAVANVTTAGKVCILDIDVQGCRSLRGRSREEIDPVFVFILPPSLEELRNRLVSRGTETPESLETRVTNATTEVRASEEPGLFDALIVNGALDTAYTELRGIIREKCCGGDL